MTALIDSNLTLVYKNMVGLSNIVTDTSGDSYFIASVSVNSNLFVSGTTIFNGSTTINSNLNISGITLVNGPTTVTSSLNVSGFTTINGPTTIASSLYILGTTNVNNNLSVNGSTIINGSVTYNSQLNVSGTATFKNDIYVNNIYGDILNINAPIINIGNANSTVFINGTATYIASTETLIVDKMISLNVNSSTLQGADIGAYSGIEIMGISSYGFIRTSADASRYQLQSPLLGATTNYITIQDSNNNLVISGTTILVGATTINSLLNISGLAIFNGAATINNSLNISGSSIISGSCTINNSLIISGTTIFNNACSINSSLSINGLVNINNAASINSSLNVLGSTIINGQMTINSSLLVSGTTNINNATSINSSLNISGITIVNGPISMNSMLNVSGNSFVGGNHTINSNLFVSGFSILNNCISINSTLQVSGASVFNNAVSFNSQLGVVGQIIAPLPEYEYNTDAKNAGIPVWGFYRTGGIIKIRLNDILPTINISGSASLNVILGSSLTDPGVYSIDYLNNNVPVYMTSIIRSGSTNLLTSNILITGTSTIITQTSLLAVDNYTATYQATDTSSNISYNYRLFNIINYVPPVISYDVTNGWMGPLYYNYSNFINGVDWTMEAWIYPINTINNFQGTEIFDFRNYPYQSYKKVFVLKANLNNTITAGPEDYPSLLNSTNKFTINAWNHVVWMRQDTNVYTFLNGIATIISSNLWTNNITDCNSLLLCNNAFELTGNSNNNYTGKYKGSICQPLITLGAKYNTAGFTPSWNLTPNSYTNVLFWLNNGVDVKSGQTIQLKNTVIQNIITSSPI